MTPSRHQLNLTRLSATGDHSAWILNKKTQPRAGTKQSRLTLERSPLRSVWVQCSCARKQERLLELAITFQQLALFYKFKSIPVKHSQADNLSITFGTFHYYLLFDNAHYCVDVFFKTFFLNKDESLQFERNHLFIFSLSLRNVHVAISGFIVRAWCSARCPWWLETDFLDLLRFHRRSLHSSMAGRFGS